MGFGGRRSDDYGVRNVGWGRKAEHGGSKEDFGRGGRGGGVRTAMLRSPAVSCFSLKFSSAKDLVP